MTQTIYFVRHGESEGNVAGVTSGAEHDCLLTEEGRAQAKQAGELLQNNPIDLIVCSPMKRTVETAEIIARTLGYDPDKIVKRKEFIERSVGYYSGRPHTEYRDAVRTKNAHSSLETSEQMHARVNAGLSWLKNQPAHNIVIVSHGGTSRIVRVIDQRLHHTDMDVVPGLANTEIYEFTL